MPVDLSDPVAISELPHPWPFPISGLPTGGLVRNVYVRPPLRPLPPIPPSDQWTQQDLIDSPPE